MIPREAARRAEASPKSKEISAATVVDIPGGGVQAAAHSHANDAAVVLNVCNNLGGACLHPAHLLYDTPVPPPLLLAGYQSGDMLGVPSCHAVDASKEEKYLDDSQRCCPPPMFIILISLLEIGVFVYDYLTVAPAAELNSTSIPSQSVLIYRPDRRLQIWRFVSYMVLHANWFHLGFNVVIQLLYGLPLEMVHGSMRVAVIYLAGVFAGSLGTSVVDSEVYLVGASGGVYALLAAQLANVLLNYGQMRYGISQLVSVLIFVTCDLSYALYSKYISVEAKAMPTVSYIAHLTGFLAGFNMGLLVLKNFDSKAQSTLLWWLALGVYAAFTVFAIVFNLINTVTAQMLEEEGEVIKQHLLHDLGIS